MADFGAAGGRSTPLSQALAAANVASVAAVLQERHKYVYGQDPNAAVGGQHDQDDAASEAHGGAYSSQPQQEAYQSLHLYAGGPTFTAY